MWCTSEQLVEGVEGCGVASAARGWEVQPLLVNPLSLHIVTWSVVV